MNYCQNCSRPVSFCACENTDWVDEEGTPLNYNEGINESVNRIVRNGGTITDKRDKGGFLGCGFKYVAGDPEW